MKMRKLSLLIVLVFFLFTSCKNDDDFNQFEISEIILDDINSMSKSVVCTDDSEWEIISFGYSQCGFKDQSIPFHSSINRESLMKKIESYTEAKKIQVKNQGDQIACLSIFEENSLVNTSKYIECVSGESIIKTKRIFKNENLLGRWKLSSARNKERDSVDIQEKMIFFSEKGEYSIETPECKALGSYSYDEKKGVVFSSSECNDNEALIFIYDFDTSILGLSYENSSEIVFETYSKVLE